MVGQNDRVTSVNVLGPEIKRQRRLQKKKESEEKIKDKERKSLTQIISERIVMTNEVRGVSLRCVV